MSVSQRLFQVLYNQLLPLLLISFGILGVWVCARAVEPVAFDKLMRLTAQRSPREKSTSELILVDDDSLNLLAKSFGSFPWSQQTCLKIYQRLKIYKPSMVVFTTPFNDSQTMTEPSVQGLQQQTSLPSNFIFGKRRNQAGMSTHFSSLSPSASSDKSLQVGLVDLDTLMADGVIRSVKPYWRTMTGSNSVIKRTSKTEAKQTPPSPSVALLAVLEYLNQQTHLQYPLKHWQLGSLPKQPLVEEGRLNLTLGQAKHKDLTYPLDLQERLLLRWYKPIGKTEDNALFTHPATPLSAIFPEFADKTKPQLTNVQLTQRFANKILILGSASNVFRDDYPTPVSYKHLAADIHATIIDNLLRQSVIQRASNWQRSLCLLLSFFGVFFLRIRLQKFSRTILYVSALMILYFWFVLYQLIAEHVIFDIVTPEIFMLLGMLAGTLWWSNYRAREILTLTHNMAQLVAPNVFKEVVRQKRGIQPGGQRLEVTVLLVDIRNFTALAENLPAGEVTDLLNAFYSVVERVVFAHVGTVDKYMGDGVLVLFGAPLESPRSADEALAAGIALLQEIDDLAEFWWQQRHIFFQVGVSFHTGPAFVGFVGPPQKLQYTALGDTVNLCVRLQEQNKRFNTPLVLSEASVNALSEANPLRSDLQELGAVVVRGRQTTVKVFTINAEQFQLKNMPHANTTAEIKALTLPNPFTL